MTANSAEYDALKCENMFIYENNLFSLNRLQNDSTGFYVKPYGVNQTYKTFLGSESESGKLSWRTLRMEDLEDVIIRNTLNQGDTLIYDAEIGKWISEDVSNIGVRNLNGITSTLQTIVTGTSGTDFNIVSSGSEHTFNIPTASITNRGLVSSSDFDNFQNKLSKVLPRGKILVGSTKYLMTPVTMKGAFTINENGVTTIASKGNPGALKFNSIIDDDGFETSGDLFYDYQSEILVTKNGVTTADLDDLNIHGYASNPVNVLNIKGETINFISGTTNDSSFKPGDVTITTGTNNSLIAPVEFISSKSRIILNSNTGLLVQADDDNDIVFELTSKTEESVKLILPQTKEQFDKFTNNNNLPFGVIDRNEQGLILGALDKYYGSFQFGIDSYSYPGISRFTPYKLAAYSYNGVGLSSNFNITLTKGAQYVSYGNIDIQPTNRKTGIDQQYIFKITWGLSNSDDKSNIINKYLKTTKIYGNVVQGWYGSFSFTFDMEDSYKCLKGTIELSDITGNPLSNFYAKNESNQITFTTI